MPLKFTHAIQISGTNDPTKQVSKDAWNANHSPNGAGSIDTYANRPASGDFVGDQYHCTDHILRYVWNGTIWAPFYGSVPVKTPLLQDWQDADLAAVNEGSAVYADLKDVTQFYWPDNTSGAAQHRVWKKAEPGSTWCVYFGLLLPPDWRDGGGRGVGIYFRNASSGRLLTMYFADDRRKVERWNTATSFNLGMVSVTEDGPHNLAWLALNNDGTNLEFFQAESRFGKWAYLYGETDAAFVNTCDEVGVGFYGGRQGSQLVPITATLIHVEEGAAI